MELAGQNFPQACLGYSAGICNAFTEIYRHPKTSTFPLSLESERSYPRAQYTLLNTCSEQKS